MGRCRCRKGDDQLCADCRHRFGVATKTELNQQGEQSASSTADCRHEDHGGEEAASQPEEEPPTKRLKESQAAASHTEEEPPTKKPKNS